MEMVLRALIVYVVVLALVRIRGKRELAQLEAFDLVLLLIVAQATGQGLLGNDSSLTTMAVVVATLLMGDKLLSVIKQRYRPFRRVAAGVPLLLMNDGDLLHYNMRSEGVDEDDLLQAARSSHGLTGLEQVRYVVMERNGALSVVPRSSARDRSTIATTPGTVRGEPGRQQ